MTSQLIAPVIPSRARPAARAGGRAVIGTLGLKPGDRLTLTGAGGVVVVRRDPAGPVVMTAKPYVVIPAVLRRRCGLWPGDRVLLAVFPGEDALAAWTSCCSMTRAARPPCASSSEDIGGR